MQSFSVLKPVTLGLIGFFTLHHAGHCAFAAERVQFESARYQVGPLQLRLARERGETTRPAADLIDGYLTKPQGEGPFPAIIHLHGCGGLSEAYKAQGRDGFWAERLVAWGYVVLSVDSFTARGISNTCTGTLATRAADAVGALTYLARQPLVDSDRIALIGFSAGGGAALSAMEARDFELFENEGGRRFKAAIAFYPHCASDGAMSAPTLILIGELDDWSLASACKAMMARRTTGSPIRLIVYPGAHHAFDVVSPGRDYFGHRLEYNAVAAEQASEDVRRFLAQHLGR